MIVVSTALIIKLKIDGLQDEVLSFFFISKSILLQ